MLISELLTKLNELKTMNKGYWQDRIIAEISYAVKLSEAENGSYDQLLWDVVCK